MDLRRTLTKAKIIQALENIPDDIPILINVEFEDGKNWDTWNACAIDMSDECPGGEWCTHTEPEMIYEAVIHVKFGDKPGCMETYEDK